MEYSKAQQLLAQIQGCTFAAMDTETVPVLKGGKKNPMQGKLVKRATGHRVMLFTNANSNAYENKVRRHLIKEGKNPDTFTLGALPWGQRIEGTPFIENKGKHYLQCVFIESGSIEYELEGQPIAAESIIGLREETGSEKQGLEDSVIVRTFSLESIKALRAFSEELTE